MAAIASDETACKQRRKDAELSIEKCFENSICHTRMINERL